MALVALHGADGWSLWRAARLAALADAPGAFPGASAQWADGGETRWRERLLDATALKVVAVQDWVPAGLVRGVVEDGRAWLHSLWVSPQVRGQGLGSRMVAAVEEWAVQQGATCIRLEVVPGNAAALALYRRHGYCETGDLGALHPHADRQLVMEKSFRSGGSARPTWRAANTACTVSILRRGGRMPALNRESFDSPAETRNFDPPSSGHLDLVAGGKVGRAVFNPGWRWSANVKPIAGTELCMQEHVCYFVSGSMTVRAKDGTEVSYGPGDYAEMAPGHDAWTVGSEPCVVIDWTGFATYAQPAG